MTQLRVVAMLEGAGFALKRHGGKHDLWEHPAGIVVTVSRGGHANPRLEGIRSAIRKAQRATGAKTGGAP